MAHSVPNPRQGHCQELSISCLYISGTPPSLSTLSRMAVAQIVNISPLKYYKNILAVVSALVLLASNPLSNGKFPCGKSLNCFSCPQMKAHKRPFKPSPYFQREPGCLRASGPLCPATLQLCEHILFSSDALLPFACLHALPALIFFTWLTLVGLQIVVNSYCSLTPNT